ncbi:MAG: 3-dehydroquinate synthase, partial [Defluviitaleaceae bacterium]|nr:3-dehydroquinate synthase [Defluviitaleaceae bacterium]
MVRIERNWDGLLPAISKIWDLGLPKKVAIVTDRPDAVEVWDLLNSNSWEISILPIVNTKDIDVFVELLKSFYEAGLQRDSLVFAFGGGGVSDVAGFAASVYMRGIDYVNLPTTLLAQADAGLGGKTGIDFLGTKNLIGNFHQPRLVYSNVDVLKTLSQKDFISGLAEVIKYGIIRDRGLLDYLCANKSAVLARDADVLTHILQVSCNIKLEIVAQDEREAGLRQLLNFGHTFGHAIESFLNFSFPHGHCVALGMVCALDYSVKYLGLPRKDADFAVELIESFGLPTKIDEHYAPEQIYGLMLGDKKVRRGELRIICT